jgi:hypothetical protein
MVPDCYSMRVHQSKIKLSHGRAFLLLTQNLPTAIGRKIKRAWAKKPNLVAGSKLQLWLRRGWRRRKYNCSTRTLVEPGCVSLMAGSSLWCAKREGSAFIGAFAPPLSISGRQMTKSISTNRRQFGCATSNWIRSIRLQAPLCHCA